MRLSLCLQAMAERRSRYDAELARQIANDNLCKDFAAKADPFSQTLTDNKEKVILACTSVLERVCMYVYVYRCKVCEYV